MSPPLWTWDALLSASGGTSEGSPSRDVAGFSIDTRSLRPGDVFVALADARDGHEFVPAAFAAGASAALVRNDYRRRGGDGALIRVPDTLRALESIGRGARARTRARVVAVTGSVGKTSTKEALRATLSEIGATHAAEKSFNNHWGVPLTLARMPADVDYGVFEIGMNHRGEIAPLARMIRPHVAVITTVEPVHIGYLGSIEAIAEEKSDIFLGLEPGGTAVIKLDSPSFSIMDHRARAVGATVKTFGLHPDANVRAAAVTLEDEGSSVVAEVDGRAVSYRVGTPGAHIVENTLGVIAALVGLGVDLSRALPALARLSAAAGRGARTTLTARDVEILLIDESYNANPASMRAALAALSGVPRTRFPRRVAVLGEMLELGAHAAALHVGLKQSIDDAGVDLIFACGPNMAQLFSSLDSSRRGHWAETSAGLQRPLLDAIKSGDVVMIKGSLGSRMAPLAETLRQRYGQ